MLTFDAEAYAQWRGVMNADGGRGYGTGVRIVACAYCGNSDGKAWMNVERGTAGCFHQSCELGGRVVRLTEWARQAEGLRRWQEAEAWLEVRFPGVTVARRAPQPERPVDFVRFPEGARWFSAHPGPRHGVLYDEAAAFLRKQWSLTLPDAERAGWGYCTAGRHAWRIVIPVVMGGVAVQFQARSYRGAEPKYRSGEIGVEAARPMEACLYGLDNLKEGWHAVIVEGAADAEVWEKGICVRAGGGGGPDSRVGKRGCSETSEHSARAGEAAVSLLGAAVTEAKLALLARKRPGRVTVALDADALAAARAIAHEVRAWGMACDVATWGGGKDAGSGARLTAAASV